MSIYINSALVLLALLPWKMCAARASAAADVVLGPQSTVLLENCSCGDGYKCPSPQPAIFKVNCSTIQAGLTLKGCGESSGSSSGKCSTVGGVDKTLTGCNFSSEDALGGSPPCSTSRCVLKLSGESNEGCGGRKIKLTSSNSNCNFFCGSISGQNQTNEQQQQPVQDGNSSNSSPSSREVESALKASPGGVSAASTTN
ncbi:hypothetical protein ERJ75_001203700 [Trypanosoma vivax]|nr:hypothetical protein ERJ75_001203700 [Trypanosoma vivax]